MKSRLYTISVLAVATAINLYFNSGNQLDTLLAPHWASEFQTKTRVVKARDEVVLKPGDILVSNFILGHIIIYVSVYIIIT